MLQQNKLLKLVNHIRAYHDDCSLADLYDPNSMPVDLLKAHNNLDKAVDACYTKDKFEHETARISFLFNLYESYLEPLL